MASSLILSSNPGSSSRKYAVYDGDYQRGRLHFEWLDGSIVCTVETDSMSKRVDVGISQMSEAAGVVRSVLNTHGILHDEDELSAIGLRVVAPGSYFLRHKVVDDEYYNRLESMRSRAPIHISSVIEELTALREQFGQVPIVGVSDSAFHITKPDYAWNYGISLDAADFHEIKRYGYHGISVSSIVHALLKDGKITPKLIVCHLGSGASITALHYGKSVDNTMGYSPLEGIIMSTRSGSVDYTALRVYKQLVSVDEMALEHKLSYESGLLGLGGSNDIRELLKRELDGDKKAALALSTYIFSVQKAIGSMVATLGGADAIVFTGTVGERSAEVRHRVMAHMHYLDFAVDEEKNLSVRSVGQPVTISRDAHSKPILIIRTEELSEIARISNLVLQKELPS